MDLQQNVRWQHLVLIAALTGLVAGTVLTALALTAAAQYRPPLWIGAIVLLGSTGSGILAFQSLRRELSASDEAKRVSDGPFIVSSLHGTSAARLSATIGAHFRLQVTGPKREFPTTFEQLVDVVTQLLTSQTQLQPAQFQHARDELAHVLQTSAGQIPWNSSPLLLIPSGRRRFPAWEALRLGLPGLSAAELHPVLHYTATYALLAGLIAITVPIAQRLDANEATRIKNTPANRITGKAIGLLLFGSIIAILMIPVHRFGRRFACKLPKDAKTLGGLAVYAPRDESSVWTQHLVAEHLRDLVAAELDVPPSAVRGDLPLVP
jgi:hypothetical protein